MINCAHPTHFAEIVERGGTWLPRLGGIRPSASRKSHAELESADGLDSGDPAELGAGIANVVVVEEIPETPLVGVTVSAG